LAAGLLLDIATVPTPLQVIGERLGVEALDLAASCGAGHLEGEAGSWRVVASQADPSGRRRFTIAHELAHVQLLALPALAPQPGQELEQFCDRLASELIMPAASFRELFSGGAVTLNAIGIAARTFDVSFSAAALRVQEVLPATIVFFVRDGAVVWGNGGIPRGKLLGIPPEVGRIVRLSLEGSAHEDRVYAQLESHDGMWNISSQKLGPGARLFVMTPVLQLRPSGRRAQLRT
jgi:IrrE N-terminal-like domain